jgi:hypothetical protein
MAGSSSAFAEFESCTIDPESSRRANFRGRAGQPRSLVASEVKARRIMGWYKSLRGSVQDLRNDVDGLKGGPGQFSSWPRRDSILHAPRRFRMIISFDGTDFSGGRAWRLGAVPYRGRWRRPSPVLGVATEVVGPSRSDAASTPWASASFTADTGATAPLLWRPASSSPRGHRLPIARGGGAALPCRYLAKGKVTTASTQSAPSRSLPAPRSLLVAVT